MLVNSGPFPIDTATLIRYGFLRSIMSRFERQTYRRGRYLRFMPKYLRMKEITDPVFQSFAIWIDGPAWFVDHYLKAIRTIQIRTEKP